MSYKLPQNNDFEKSAEIFRLINEYCGDAHFVLSILPIIDDDEFVSHPINLSTLPLEEIPDVLERMAITANAGLERETYTKTDIKQSSETMH